MPASAGSTADPYRNYTLQLSDGNCWYLGSKLTGLIPPEVVRHRSGGDTSTPLKSPGRYQYEAITLDRGVTQDPSFSGWAGQVAAQLTSADVAEYRDGEEGGLSPRKITGQNKSGDVTLKRGVVQDQSLNNWASSVQNYGSNSGAETSSQNFRKDILLQFYNEAGQLVVRYQIKPRRVLEFRSGAGGGVSYHSLFPGDAKRLGEQLASIFENSLRQVSPAG